MITQVAWLEAFVFLLFFSKYIAVLRIAEFEFLELRSSVYYEVTGFTMAGVPRKLEILPRRFGGVVPGVSPVVDAISGFLIC